VKKENRKRQHITDRTWLHYTKKEIRDIHKVATREKLSLQEVKIRFDIVPSTYKQKCALLGLDVTDASKGRKLRPFMDDVAKYGEAIVHAIEEDLCSASETTRRLNLPWNPHKTNDIYEHITGRRLTLNRNKLTKKDHKRIVALYKDGGTLRGIANEFGVVHAQIAKVLHANGVKLRLMGRLVKPNSKEEKEVVRLRLEDRLPITKIASIVGLSSSTVKRILDKVNVPKGRATSIFYTVPEKLIVECNKKYTTSTITLEEAAEELRRTLITSYGLKDNSNLLTGEKLRLKFKELGLPRKSPKLVSDERGKKFRKFSDTKVREAYRHYQAGATLWQCAELLGGTSTQCARYNFLRLGLRTRTLKEAKRMQREGIPKQKSATFTAKKKKTRKK
jgi:transposase-like protein